MTRRCNRRWVGGARVSSGGLTDARTVFILPGREGGIMEPVTLSFRRWHRHHHLSSPLKCYCCQDYQPCRPSPHQHHSLDLHATKSIITTKLDVTTIIITITTTFKFTLDRSIRGKMFPSPPYLSTELASLRSSHFLTPSLKFYGKQKTAANHYQHQHHYHYHYHFQSSTPISISPENMNTTITAKRFVKSPLSHHTYHPKQRVLIHVNILPHSTHTHASRMRKA